MSGWIKFDKDMATDPRLMDAAVTLASQYHFGIATSSVGARSLSNSNALLFFTNALRGALVTLWAYADTHIRDDDTLPISSDALDALVGIEGFCAIVPDDWVVKLDAHTTKLPGYCAKNDLISKKKRRQDAKDRQSAWRARQNKGPGIHDQSVTRESRVTQGVNNATRNEPVTHNKMCKTETKTEDQDLKSRDKSREVPRAARSTATRLAENFELTLDRRAYAMQQGIDPDRTFEKFIDYWRSASGAKARKHDWDATWRNWCRTEADRSPRVNGKPEGQPKITWRPTANDDLPLEQAS